MPNQNLGDQAPHNVFDDAGHGKMLVMGRCWSWEDAGAAVSHGKQMYFEMVILSLFSVSLFQLLLL